MDNAYSNTLYVYVFISLQLEKVLQQGDVGDAAEPYYRGHDIDKKLHEKSKTNAKLYCKQLGQYRMPFAWAAINVIDLIAGNQSTMGTSHTAVTTQDSPRDRTDSTSSNRRNSGSNTGTQERNKAQTTEPIRRSKDGRTSSMTSQSSRIGMEEGGMDDDCIIPQNFSPVTLSLNMFFKQV